MTDAPFVMTIVRDAGKEYILAGDVFKWMRYMADEADAQKSPSVGSVIRILAEGLEAHYRTTMMLYDEGHKLND